jgi:hypothetical protein
LVYQAEAFSDNVKQTILAELDAFEVSYPHENWKATGRLARIGLPHGIVTSLRHLRAALNAKAQILLRDKA